MRRSLLSGVLFVLPRRKKMPLAMSYKMDPISALWVRKQGGGDRWMNCINIEQNPWLANLFNMGGNSFLPFTIFLEISPTRDLLRLSRCCLFKRKQVLSPKGRKGFSFLGWKIRE